MHCGHYVAHLFQDGEWIMFNDDKVVKMSTQEVNSMVESDVYVVMLQRA